MIILASKYKYSTKSIYKTAISTTIQIKWMIPPSIFFNLNIDVTFKKKERVDVDVGGVMRNSNGD